MNHSCVVTPTATIPVPASLQGVSQLEFADFSMNGEHLNLPGRGSCDRHLAVVMVLLVLAHRAKAVKTEENYIEFTTVRCRLGTALPKVTLQDRSFQ